MADAMLGDGRDANDVHSWGSTVGLRRKEEKGRKARPPGWRESSDRQDHGSGEKGLITLNSGRQSLNFYY
jgi:hypothetical protein